MPAVTSPFFKPVPVVKDSTVWVTFPDAGVDRPRTYGISCPNPKLRVRLVAAINAGVVTGWGRVSTGVNGKTYVSFTVNINPRRLNTGLKKLGF
jgi:hypothetical protein